ncbi:MAG: hypothetical protein IJ532_07535 [Alphaproteobacteria bacterium]|nr:hypothetical protein [Alphaproteobacteria bacterium]
MLYMDEKWYFEQYPDAQKSGLNAEEHYNTIGWKKGYNPSKFFDTIYYLTRYPDIEKAGINPLSHYLKHGIKEGRRPNPNPLYELYNIYMDEKWYFEQYPDAQKSGLNAEEHYNTIGWKKGYNPSKFFDTKFYLENHKSIKNWNISPLEHFLQYGLNLGYYPGNRGINYYSSLSYEECKKAILEWWWHVKKIPLNLHTPKSFNEKIQWLKLYDSTPIKTRLADKYLVRDWVTEKIGEQYLIPLIGVYDKFEDINFSELPNQFVIKCNHGSGYNIVVNDKSKLNMEDTKKKLDRWMSENFAFRGGFELHYINIPHKIIIEKFLTNDGKALYDYKFWCFNGEVKYMQFRDDFSENLKMVFYDLDWKKQYFYYDHPLYEEPLKKPDNYQEMIDIAKKLCQGFAFVCVDLYRLENGNIKFGEMTFTRSSGGAHWNDEKYNIMLGNMIKLPEFAYNFDTGEYYKPE